VVVDTPAASLGTDATVIASKCGSALIVARQDVSRVGALNDLSARVSAATAKLVGVVLNEY